MSKKARSGDKDSIFQRDVFGKAKELLERGLQLRSVEWKPADLAALRPLFLLTIKPTLYVANVGEDDFAGTGEFARAVADHAEQVGADWLPVCGDIECELSGMEGEDRAMFMSDLGLQELALPRLLQRTYDLLGLMTFFTAGPIEIKAWTVCKGDRGPVAAGKIHTDFEKGFIRAEVFSVEDLAKFESEAAIRQAGKLRIEGREYVVRNGDICHFLVNR